MFHSIVDCSLYCAICVTYYKLMYYLVIYKVEYTHTQTLTPVTL